MTNEAAKKKQLPAFLALTIICLVAALALAGTNAITKGPIAELAMAAQREAFGAVMTADEYVEMTIPEGSGASALVEAKVGGETVGYCVAASSTGYAGPVAVTLGVGTDGKITGAKIGDNSFAETSGFGSRWLAENQTEQFVGIDVKEGGAIEALSGATVTSNAVLNAANTALATVNGVLGNGRTEPVLVFGVAEKKPVEQMALVGDIHEGSARGFASEVKVQLTMDDAGAITGLAIESSGETPSFGTRCMEEPAFAEQFVGKTAPFAIGGNIDALTGATVTSTAVVEAVNAAVAAPANPDAVPFGSGAEETVEAAATLTGDVKTGKAQGFQSEVTVQLTVDENGAIAEILIDSASETPGFGTRCAEDEAYLAQFVGKTAPVAVDALSGATVTSTAVVEAVNAALTAPAAEVPAGTAYEGTAQGFQSEVKVTLYVDDAKVITGIKVDSASETPGFGTRCAEDEAYLAQFVGKKATPDLGEGIDALSGATVTSNAVIEAANAAIGVAVEEVEIPAAAPLTAAAVGFAGKDVGVSVVLNEDGTIGALTIDNSQQVPPVCDLCNTDEFLGQFIGKKGPFVKGENVDIVTGATFTSEGIINAVNSLFPAEEAPAAAPLT
ncbi:MAG: FMN-binding protein, partial [Clostridia bacterium]|nr:FMN-binding protein [Clostridia bacterium]